MKKISRHHHYLSQFYLKGFTDGRSKKSKLIVIDVKNKKSFSTTPRNVGGVRDFNRIEIDGVPPDTLENALSEFEGQAATAIKNIEKNMAFVGDDKAAILNLIALLAIRSPEIREHSRKFHAEIAERVMDLSLATKERWESQMDQMKRDGYEVNDNVTYEDMKKFHDSKEYKIEVAREWHIELEFVGMDAILPCLFERSWLLVKRGGSCSPLISCDRPVILTWKKPDDVPPMYRSSPGYGMRDTMVYFPLSQDLGLIGEFEGEDGVIEADNHFIAHLNSLMLHMTYGQVYSPKLSFKAVGIDGLVDGRDILRQVPA